MSDLNWKWIFTFTMLFATIGWAVFCVLVVKWSATHVVQGNATQLDVVGGAGASFFLGSMSTWMGQIIQHWYRKKPTIEKPEDRADV